MTRPRIPTGPVAEPAAALGASHRCCRPKSPSCHWCVAPSSPRRSPQKSPRTNRRRSPRRNRPTNHRRSPHCFHRPACRTGLPSRRQPRSTSRPGRRSPSCRSHFANHDSLASLQFSREVGAVAGSRTATPGERPCNARKIRRHPPGESRGRARGPLPACPTSDSDRLPPAAAAGGPPDTLPDRPPFRWSPVARRGAMLCVEAGRVAAARAPRACRRRAKPPPPGPRP